MFTPIQLPYSKSFYRGTYEDHYCRLREVGELRVEYLLWMLLAFLVSVSSQESVELIWALNDQQ
jgi:hypothetical protein